MSEPVASVRRRAEPLTAPPVSVHALGALRVTTPAGDAALGGPRQRRLLAVLLIHLGSVVSADRLAEAVFAGAPTAAARTTLRSYVARLRRVLGDAVVTRAPGYQLVLPAELFDVARFEHRLAEARRALAREEHAAAAGLLRRALDLWQGEAYAEFADEDWAHSEHERLGELRLSARELLVDTELACGRHLEVLATIEALRRAHPLREAFRAQLMTALYRSGRQADALAEYRAFRSELADELGIDPCPALVDLERRILDQDPDLLVVAAGPDRLRGYRLGERLGAGARATVRAARLPGLDRDLVVKSWRAEAADDADLIRSFEATARRVAGLRHRGVVPIHDFWREPGAAHLVMRRLPGGTLQDRLERGPLPVPELVRLVDRVGGALAAASRAGLVHGGVTARSILYDAHGEPVLTDFALDRQDDGAHDAADLVALVRECLDPAASDDPGLVARLSQAAATRDVGEATRLLLAALAPDARTPSPASRNPYQGLQAFAESDADNFFGREAVVDALVSRLADDASRLLLVVGPSGTGKSSVVRAGLLPALRRGAVPGAGEWFVATMLPGAAPYLELGAALRTITTTAHEAACVPSHDLVGVDRTLRTVVPEEGQLLLVVDQLEELFTLAHEDEQQAFLAALSHAVHVAGSRLRVVATLRADFYDRPLAVPGFATLVESATVAIPAMLPAEVEAAVVQPAVRAGRSVERALVTELVAAVSHEPAALPALQLALYELAERSTGGELELSDYRALGGVEGVISARAEELYLSLGDADRLRVREMFERLVVVDTGGEPTRRRASRAELAAGAEEVDRWATARLLTLDVDPQTRQPTVEVSHEALVREWPRLRSWLEEDRAALVVLARLRDAASTWEQQGRDPLALWRGTSLEAALDVTAGRHDVAAVEREFVEAGRAAREEEQAAAADRIREQDRTNRRLRGQLAAIALALVGALVGGFLAVDQRREAVAERHVATARELAAAAEANLRDDPERSILLGLAAVDATRRYDEPVLPEAQEALHRAITSSRVLMSVPGVGGSLDWSPDGRVFASEGPEETGILDLRDARTGDSIRSWRADDTDLNDVAFSADSELLVTAGDDSAVKVWAVRTGRLVSSFTDPGSGPVWGPSTSRDGRYVAAAWTGADRVRVLSTRTGEVVSELTAPVPADTAFSPDGTRLAVSAFNPDHRSGVYDVRTGRRLATLRSGWGGVRDVAWSPDGRWVAFATGDRAAVVADARTGRLRAASSGNLAAVNGVDWSPDSSRLATSSDDGTVRVLELTPAGLRELYRLTAQDFSNGARSVVFSPDGERLMSSDWAITSVKIWDLRDLGAAEITNFAVDGGSGRDAAAVFAADGESVFLGSPDGELEERTLDGRLLRRFTGPRARPTQWAFVAPSPDGQLLAATSWDLPVRVWDLDTGELVFSTGAPGWPGGLSWSADSRLLAFGRHVDGNGAEVGSAVVVDRTGEQVGRVEEPRVAVTSVAFRGDGDELALTTRDPRDDPDLMRVRVWDWRRGEPLRSMAPVSAVVRTARKGPLLATARFLVGRADVWDGSTGDRVSTLTGHTAAVTNLDFSPDGRRVATSSLDGTIRVWDARSGRLEVSLRGPGASASVGVRFHPDGTRLLSTSADGVARLWTLDTDQLTRIARTRVTRGLSDAECRQYLHVPSCPAP